jgi:hypothetical protein
MNVVNQITFASFANSLSLNRSDLVADIVVAYLNFVVQNK